MPIDLRMHAAITDLHAYALAMDAERLRREEPHRTQIGEELDALRDAITALCRDVDPAGEIL